MCGASVACSALACGSDSGDPTPIGDVNAGLVSALPVGTLKNMGGGAVIGRDAEGFYALTSTCTHQGGTVVPVDAGTVLQCPRHGSRFDKNGAVLKGPASSPLAHYRVTIEPDNSVIIHGGTQVASNVRVPAPA